jgi:hypothetical protein
MPARALDRRTRRPLLSNAERAERPPGRRWIVNRQSNLITKREPNQNRTQRRIADSARADFGLRQPNGVAQIIRFCAPTGRPASWQA